jgi:hypothetical protein
LEIITLFDDFTVQHISRDENTVANDFAQQASGFRSNRGKFSFLKRSDVPVFGRCTVHQSILFDQVQQNWMVRFLKPEGTEFPGTQMNQAK